MNRTTGASERVRDSSTPWVVPILFGALVRCSVTLVLFHRGTFYADEQQYWDLAGSLLDGRGLALPYDFFGGYMKAGEPTAYYGAFPVFAAGLRWLTGSHLLQARCLLALGSWLVTANFLARYLRLAGVKGHIISLTLWLLALYPNLLFIGSFVMSENILVPTVMVTLYLGRRLRSTGSPRTSISLGFAYAIAHLVRPNVVGFQLPHLAYCCIRRRWRTGLGLLSLCLLATLIGLAPWLIRNQLVFSHPVLETKSGFNLLLYNHLGHNKPILQEDLAGPVNLPALSGLNEAERSIKCRDQFLHEILLPHPGQYLRLSLVRFLRTFALSPMSVPMPRPVVLGMSALNAVFYLLALLGGVLCWRRRMLGDAIGLCLFTVLFTALTNGAPRFRAHVDPLMVTFAAVAITARAPVGRRA